MVIYMHNKHAEPLEQVLRAALGTVETEAEQEAALNALAMIEREKCAAPYRLWQRDEKARTAVIPPAVPADKEKKL